MTHTLIVRIIAVSMLFLFSGLLNAQGSLKDRMIDQKFAAADKNHDGKLTLAEAQAGMPRVAANFDKIDSKKLGYVTLEQVKAAAER